MIKNEVEVYRTLPPRLPSLNREKNLSDDGDADYLLTFNHVLGWR